jgi:hypothetical protein
MVIWKLNLKTMEQYQGVRVPKGAVFLCAREQRDLITVWYLCNPPTDPKTEDADWETRVLIVCLTGGEVPPIPNRYLGTVLLQSGSFVVHVFEKI